jgi:hypothetical protein
MACSLVVVPLYVSFPVFGSHAVNDSRPPTLSRPVDLVPRTSLRQTLAMLKAAGVAGVMAQQLTHKASGYASLAFGDPSENTLGGTKLATSKSVQ